MAEYKVELKASAQKELERLPSKLIERIIPKLEDLSTEPRPRGSKKLKGGDREHRIRVGEYRVIYTIEDARRSISVTRIRHRSEVYD